jgi:hypothetical protein
MRLPNIPKVSIAARRLPAGRSLHEVQVQDTGRETLSVV